MNDNRPPDQSPLGAILLTVFLIFVTWSLWSIRQDVASVASAVQLIASQDKGSHP